MLLLFTLKRTLFFYGQIVSRDKSKLISILRLLIWRILWMPNPVVCKSLRWRNPSISIQTHTLLEAWKSHFSRSYWIRITLKCVAQIVLPFSEKLEFTLIAFRRLNTSDRFQIRVFSRKNISILIRKSMLKRDLGLLC